MLILASSSPTRAKILNSFGIDFIQKSIEFDEDAIATQSPREFVYLATTGKMKEAKKTLGADMPLLCADTVVSVNNQILRKAKSKDDAKRLLGMQSGAKVDIITCTAYSKKSMGYLDISVTSYIFEEFRENDLTSYLDSGDWEGKAGAIMVEGFAKPYIKKVTGFESCAMGLSFEKLLPFL